MQKRLKNTGLEKFEW